MIELMVSTGFQSSLYRKYRKQFTSIFSTIIYYLNILRQILPSRSMLGWYTGVSHFTFGGSCGYPWPICVCVILYMHYCDGSLAYLKVEDKSSISVKALRYM